MLTEREKIHACALRGELARCAVLLTAVAAAAIGFAALAWLCRGAGLWDLFALVAVVDLAIAAGVGGRVLRVQRHIAKLEGLR